MPPPEGAGADGRGGAATPAGVGIEGAFGEVAAEATPMGAVVGPPTGSGEVPSTGAVGAMGPVAGMAVTGAVEGPPEGIGEVEPLGATGPESSA